MRLLEFAFEVVLDTVDRPSKIESLLETYGGLVGLRDEFLWKWLYASVQPIRLSCVPSEHQETVTTAKTIGMVYVTVLDDIADQLGDPQILDAVALIQAGNADTIDPDQLVHDREAAAHLEFAREAWGALETTLRDAPRADEFWPLLEFDLRKMLMSMWYSVIVNDVPAMANLTEGLGHESQNFAHYMAADIDLMYSPRFDHADLAQLRSTLWRGQQLHRLVNWVCTWERELDEGDVTAGVFALAIEQNLIDVNTLERIDDDVIDTAAVQTLIHDQNLEQHLVDRWTRQYHATLHAARTAETHSVDLVDYVTGVRRVCQNCLIAEGYK